MKDEMGFLIRLGSESYLIVTEEEVLPDVVVNSLFRMMNKKLSAESFRRLALQITRVKYTFYFDEDSNCVVWEGENISGETYDVHVWRC